jgi:hypothetical protein
LQVLSKEEKGKKEKGKEKDLTQRHLRREVALVGKTRLKPVLLEVEDGNGDGDEG